MKRLQNNEKFTPISELFFFASLDDLLTDYIQLGVIQEMKE